jgi:serine/threonine protein kinase
MEIEILWSLGHHEHCINLYNAWEQHGHLYILMELCETGT